MVDLYVLPHLEIIMNDNLGFSENVFGSYFPEDHPLYLDDRLTVRNITLYNGGVHIVRCCVYNGT